MGIDDSIECLFITMVLIRIIVLEAFGVSYMLTKNKKKWFLFLLVAIVYGLLLVLLNEPLTEVVKQVVYLIAFCLMFVIIS